MNLDSLDCEVFDKDGYFAIKNSEIISEDPQTITVQCTLQGNHSKESVEQYLSDEQGKKVIINTI